MNKITKIIALLDVLLLVGLGYAIWHRVNTPSEATKQAVLNTKSPVISSKTGTSPDGAPSLSELSARNNERDQDANSLLGAINEYAASNNGQLPKSIANGKLQGGSVTITLPKFAHFTSVTMASGTQAAVTQDKLVLVINATCKADGSASAGTSRQFVALYGTEKVSGSYEATCVAS